MKVSIIVESFLFLILTYLYFPSIIVFAIKHKGKRVNIIDNSIAIQRVYTPPKNYQGCFKDSSDRMFDTMHYLFQTCSAKTCVDLCRNGGFVYAGTQYGNECYCGNKFPSPPNHPAVDENECEMECEGDANEKCGGRWTMSVYETGNESKELKQESTTSKIVDDESSEDDDYEASGDDESSSEDNEEVISFPPVFSRIG